MSLRLFRVLNIEKDEQTIVSLLILQSVFLGIFAGFFDVGAHSLFLKAYDASLIPRAFMISGIVGIVITSVYTRLQHRMGFSSFSLINLSFVAISTILIRIGFEFSSSKSVVFIAFVLMGPLTIISFLGFWGNVSRIFTLRQGKRLFGIIDTGQIGGIILSSYAVPVLIRFRFAVHDTLLICAGSILAALIVQMIITRSAKVSEKVQFLKIERTKQTGFMELFKSRYTLLITFFVMFSVISAFFVHYSFISTVQANYPESESLASFLGAFMGTLTVFTVIVKTFIYGKLMKTYGLQLTLILSPLLLGLFSILILISGGLYGFTIGASGFIFVFLLLSLSKLMAKSLKDSIEVPSLKILYQAIQLETRYDVQARVDGTVNEISAFFSGLVLAGLGLIATVKLIHNSAVLLGIVIMWIFTGVLLHKAYRDSLYTALTKTRFSKVTSDDLFENIEVEKDNLHGNMLFYSLRLMPQLWNGFLSRKIRSLIAHPEKIIRDETLRLLDILGFSRKEIDLSIGSIDKLEDQGIRRNREQEIYDIHATNSSSDKKNISALKDTIYDYAASENMNLHTNLIPLFKDNDSAIRACAIRNSGKVQDRDIIHYLVDMLADKILYHQAFHALIKIGKPALESLDNAFYKNTLSDKGLKRIIRAFENMDTPEKIPVLTEKLEHYNLFVVKEALQGIIRSEASVASIDLPKHIAILNRIVEVAARNFTLLVSVKMYMPHSELVTALEEEYYENIDTIFSFLSLAYDYKSIYYIRQNYESGTTEGIGYAIELLDMLIDNTIKPFLFPLFEDNSDYDKVKKLQITYPVEIMKFPDVLLSLLNSDKNQLGIYVRALAIMELLSYQDLSITDILVAQVFHPSKAVREAAISVILKFNHGLIPDIFKRIEHNISDELSVFVKNLKHNQFAGEWRKIIFLRNSSAFSFIKRKMLPQLAENCSLIDLKKSKYYRASELFDDDEVILLVTEKFYIKDSNGKELRLKNDMLFLTSQLLKHHGEDILIKAGNDTAILKISEDDMREYIFDNEMEGMRIINKISECHEVFLNS